MKRLFFIVPIFLLGCAGLSHLLSTGAGISGAEIDSTSSAIETLLNNPDTLLTGGALTGVAYLIILIRRLFKKKA